MVQLNCKNITKASKFPVYQKLNSYLKTAYDRKSIKKEIFNHCIKPKPGTEITASFFHLVPLINIMEVPGEIVKFG